MRTLIFCLIILSKFSYTSVGQEIESNYIDEFTKTRKVFTSWGKLIYNFNGNSFYRFKVLDSVAVFDFKYLIDCNVDKGASFYFKCDNDSIIELKSLDYYISKRGAGSIGGMSSNVIGINSQYFIKKEFIEYLSNHSIVKVRLVCNSGYNEIDINKRNSAIFKKSCQIILPFVKN